MPSKKKRVNKTRKNDFDSLLTPCFKISSNVTLSDVPATGEEYLLSVIKEREKCVTVTKCNIDYSKFAQNQSRFVKELPYAKSPDSLKPTKEWQSIQVADFSDVQIYISQLLLNKSIWPVSVKKLRIDADDVNAWKKLFEEDPKLSCVLRLRNAILDRGLEMLIEIMSDVKPGNTINHKTGQWIYAILACKRHPLLSDTTSILRSLARKCAEIRSHLNPEDESSVTAVRPLNIFICLVSQYFRQYDLAD